MACCLRIAIAAFLLGSFGSARGDSPSEAKSDGRAPSVNYARDVRPILSDNCFACHGPDDQKRKAGLRLDTKEGAFSKLKSGSVAIVPGKPDESELIDRIENDDPDLQMPPKKSGKQLTAAQIAVLRRWVEQGAPTTTHWAFEAPRKPAAAGRQEDGLARSREIDRFILARLEAEGLSPAPEAEKTTLIRRVTLDLTGLPPTLEEVDAFLADRSPQAYEKVVDRLLRSPRYGEHMARFWLDAARYGDTHGLHLDNYREIWPYREWVINAFNANKPFDRFIVEQLAGDLLPNPSPDQLIATGFNRCHVSTNEGGSIEEEVYVRNIVDQVDTNGTVFLGLTTGCARCHDHKYDPIRAKDYYQLFAFFNNIDGPPMDGNGARWAPIVPVPTPKASRGAPGRSKQRSPGCKQAKSETLARLMAAADQLKDDGDLEAGREQDRVRLDRRRTAARAPRRRATAPGNSWKSRTTPSSAAGLLCATGPKGMKQRFFDNAARKLRVGAGDTLFAYVYMNSAEPAQGADASVAHQGELDAPRLLGRKPDRLRQGRHARADAPGRPARAGKVGAAGGAGGEAQAGSRHRDRGLGIHPVRRHGLLGQSRNRDRDAAGWAAL